MSREASARYCEKTTKDFKKSRERHQNLYEEEKTESENMVANDIKMQKNKTKTDRCFIILQKTI